MHLSDSVFIAIASIFGSWMLVTGGIWKLFERIEKVASESARQEVSSWLVRESKEGLFLRWANVFSGIFDNVFGERHFSWKCFFKSSLASFLAVLLVTIVWALLRNDQFDDFINSEDVYIHIVVMIFLSIVVNLLPDYISLLESRYIIGRLRENGSVSKNITFLVIDFVATSIIGFLAYAGILVVFDEDPMDMFITYILPLSAQCVGQPALGIWFYSTFFTSVWVWIFLASGFFISVQRISDFLRIKFRWFFDVENKPFISIGVVGIVIITLLYAVLIFATLL